MAATDTRHLERHPRRGRASRDGPAGARRAAAAASERPLATGVTLRIRLAGDSALLVEFGDAISIETNEAVHRLDEALQQAALAGIVETIPTYRALLVVFDPATSAPEALAASIQTLAAELSTAADPGPRRRDRRRWFIPACFGGEFGLDLRDVAARVGLAPAEVVRRHCETDYRVYMIGFSPGFAYLGGLPAELRLPRREDPRLSTPAGSVMQGGDQAAISPLAMPSGWHLLGRTPVPIFDLRRPRRPFLLAPGDRVRFEAIDPDRYAQLVRQAEADPMAPDSELLALE